MKEYECAQPHLPSPLKKGPPGPASKVRMTQICNPTPHPPPPKKKHCMLALKDRNGLVVSAMFRMFDLLSLLHSKEM